MSKNGHECELPERAVFNIERRAHRCDDETEESSTDDQLRKEARIKTRK